MPIVRIHAFDFDGTLTTHDTLLAFIRYAKGTKALVKGFLRHAHLLVLMKLHLYPNWKAKQRIFSYYFRGMGEDTFNALCRSFAADSRHLLRLKGVETMRQAAAEGAEIVVISASIDNWVRPFFEGDDRLPPVTVIGTQIEVRDGRLTGRFLTPNCYGQEKVERFLALYPHRETYHLTAYGDSRGDHELLAFADQGFLRSF